MSSDDDKCFQCQETGHMAHYCPHIRCFNCYNYGHVAADCPNKIPPSGTPARFNITSRHDRSTSCNHNHTRHYHHDHRERHRFSKSQSHPHNLDIGVRVTVILAEVTLDPFTGPHAIAHHATETQAHTTTTETHHTTDHHHAGISPEMTADPEHTNLINTITKPHKDHLPVHIQHPGNPKVGSTNRLQLMIHPQSIIALMNRTVIQRMI